MSQKESRPEKLAEPPNLTPEGFYESYRNLQPGSSLVYHVGFLARDRVQFDMKNLRVVADHVLKLAMDRDETLHVPGSDTRRPYANEFGFGSAYIFQRKLCNFVYEYVIVKRPSSAIR